MSQLYPHLHVRPVAGAEAKFPMRLNKHKLIGAAALAAVAASVQSEPDKMAPDGQSRAWFSLEGFKQSARELMRMKDRLQLHNERFERMEAAAEVMLLGSFPSYSASSTKTFNLTGTLPPGYEVREIHCIVEGTLVTNSSTGTIILADYNILAAAIISRIRASGYNVTDWHSLTSVESSSLAVYAKGRDVRQEYLRIGAGMTTTTPGAVKLKFIIPWVNRNLEVPEIFTPSSDQLNLPGNKLDIDTLGTALTTLSIGGATCTFAVTDVKAYAVGNVVPVLHAGPPHYQRTRSVAQSIDSETGAGLDQFLASEETLANGITRVTTWNVSRDGREAPRNMAPWDLAMLYGDEIRSVDGVLPYDFTQPAGLLSVGAPGTQAGAQLVPLVWAGGQVRESSAQWAFYLSSRTIRQQVAAGQSAAFTLLYWQTRPIYEAAGQVIALARANGLDVTSVDQLVVRGGYDGSANKLFKGRLMALPSKAA